MKYLIESCWIYSQKLNGMLLYEQAGNESKKWHADFYKSALMLVTLNVL